MIRFIPSLFVAFGLLFTNVLPSQTVNGQLQSNTSANVHVVRLFADSFPRVSLTFHAEDTQGNPLWNLKQSDVSVTENSQQGKIVDFRLVSQEKHLQTMLVIDHSGSMNEDWNYWEWYNTLNQDSLPVDTIRQYYICRDTPKDFNPEMGYYPCEVSELRDTFYIAKRLPRHADFIPPLWYAQQGAKQFIKSFKSKQDSTGIIGFASTPDFYLPYAPNNATTYNAIDQLEADGATAFYDALDQSLNHLVYHRGQRAIVALTDGDDNSSRVKLDAVIAKAKKMRCPIYIIGLGSVNPYALQQIVNETGGELFMTTDPTKLDEVFLKISRKLQSVYELVYESPFLKSSDETHALQLKFDVGKQFLKSQLIDLPLPESVIVHLQQKEKKQQDFQANYPLEMSESEIATIDSPVFDQPVPIAIPPAKEFPYTSLGITLLVAGAGTLIYRKRKATQEKETLVLQPVFPNPSSGIITINYVSSTELPFVTLRVFNQSGTLVTEEEIQQSGMPINLERLSNGLYLLQVTSTTHVSNTEKAIIQH